MKKLIFFILFLITIGFVGYYWASENNFKIGKIKLPVSKTQQYKKRKQVKNTNFRSRFTKKPFRVYKNNTKKEMEKINRKMKKILGKT